MKTITIYGLLGMIKDDKVLPKKIKFHNGTYELDNNGYNSDYYDEITKRWLFFDKWALTNNLNDEVEILEEEKKIPEKLDYCEENTFIIKCKENSYLTREEMKLLDSNFKEIGNKINEIIDYLKSKGE